MDKRTQEIVRYLGLGKHAVEERILQLIHELYSELETIAEPKYVYRIFELSMPGDNELQIGNLVIESDKLYKNLNGCHEVVLMAITLGIAVDRRMKQLEIQDISKAIVFQACATVYMEEQCDALQEQIAREMAEDGNYTRPRFSPGYGSFSVTYQKEILDMLQATKFTGISLTEGYMLTPTKSVTAVIGLCKTKTSCHKKGCEVCTKQDCLYRRS